MGRHATQHEGIRRVCCSFPVPPSPESCPYRCRLVAPSSDGRVSKWRGIGKSLFLFSTGCGGWEKKEIPGGFPSEQQLSCLHTYLAKDALSSASLWENHGDVATASPRSPPTPNNIYFPSSALPQSCRKKKKVFSSSLKTLQVHGECTHVRTMEIESIPLLPSTENVTDSLLYPPPAARPCHDPTFRNSLHSLSFSFCCL